MRDKYAEYRTQLHLCGTPCKLAAISLSPMSEQKRHNGSLHHRKKHDLEKSIDVLKLSRRCP